MAVFCYNFFKVQLVNNNNNITTTTNNISGFLHCAYRHSVTLKALQHPVFYARYVGLRLKYETYSFT